MITPGAPLVDGTALAAVAVLTAAGMLSDIASPFPR